MRQPQGAKVRRILSWVDEHGYTSIKALAAVLTESGHPVTASLVRYAMKTYRPQMYLDGQVQNRLKRGWFLLESDPESPSAS